jgi:hypothetical protein
MVPTPVSHSFEFMADLKPLVGLSLDFASLAVKFTEETKTKKHKNKNEKLESFMTHPPASNTHGLSGCCCWVII